MAFTQPGIIFYKEATGNLGVAEGTLEELDVRNLLLIFSVFSCSKDKRN